MMLEHGYEDIDFADHCLRLVNNNVDNLIEFLCYLEVDYRDIPYLVEQAAGVSLEIYHDQ